MDFIFNQPIDVNFSSTVFGFQDSVIYRRQAALSDSLFF